MARPDRPDAAQLAEEKVECHAKQDNQERSWDQRLLEPLERSHATSSNTEPMPIRGLPDEIGNGLHQFGEGVLLIRLRNAISPSGSGSCPTT